MVAVAPPRRYNHGSEGCRIPLQSALRPYLYGGKVCEPGDPNEELLLTMAELLADACEHGLLMANHLPVDEQWREYPKELLANSPVVRKVVLSGPLFWPRMANELRRLDRPLSTEDDGPGAVAA